MRGLPIFAFLAFACLAIQAKAVSTESNDLFDYDHDNKDIQRFIKLKSKYGFHFDEPCEFCGGDYPLVAAVKASNVDVIKFLAANGVNVNGGIKKTPLIVAIEEGDTDLVELLLELGADPHAISSGKQYAHHPIIHAIFLDQMDILKLLLNKTKKVNFSHRGFSPLSAAVFYGRKDMVEELLLAGADPRMDVEDGETALHKAALFDDPGHIEIAKLLVYSGADPSAVNAAGESPISLARKSRPFSVIYGKWEEKPLGMESALINLKHLQRKSPRAPDSLKSRKPRLTMSMDSLRNAVSPRSTGKRKSTSPSSLGKSKL